MNEHGLKHLYTSEPKSFCYCTTLGIREGSQYTSHYLKTWIFFIHTEYSGSLKLHLGMMVQHHSMRKGEKTVTILKRSIWEIHMYYIITMAIIQFECILSGVYLWGPVAVTYYPLQSLRPTLHHSMQCSLQNFQLKKFPLLKTFNMIKIYELFCSANLVEIPK